MIYAYMVLPHCSEVKNLLQCRRHRFNPWVRKIPWRRNRQPTLVSLPGNPMDRGPWHITAYGVQRVEHDLGTKEQQIYIYTYLFNKYKTEYIGSKIQTIKDHKIPSG